MFTWLMNHVFDREGYRRFKEEFARLEEHEKTIAALNARIRASFTPEEWAETERRCMAKLAAYGYGDFDEALAALTASELNEWVAWLNDHTGGESGPIVPPAN